VFNFLKGFFSLGMVILCSGCLLKPNVSPTRSPFSNIEAQWIRDGKPMEFEGELWYPKDGIETLLNSEVLLLTTYIGIPLFIDKIDVRPYNRLYTKFAPNKFRYFERKKEDDSY
jgi:hypothetical protein